jgi:hypothetical protein
MSDVRREVISPAPVTSKKAIFCRTMDPKYDCLRRRVTCSPV